MVREQLRQWCRGPVMAQDKPGNEEEEIHGITTEVAPYLIWGSHNGRKWHWGQHQVKDRIQRWWCWLGGSSLSENCSIAWSRAGREMLHHQSTLVPASIISYLDTHNSFLFGLSASPLAPQYRYNITAGEILHLKQANKNKTKQNFERNNKEKFCISFM